MQIPVCLQKCDVAWHIGLVFLSAAVKQILRQWENTLLCVQILRFEKVCKIAHLIIIYLHYWITIIDALMFIHYLAVACYLMYC